MLGQTQGFALGLANVGAKCVPIEVGVVIVVFSIGPQIREEIECGENFLTNCSCGAAADVGRDW